MGKISIFEKGYTALQKIVPMIRAGAKTEKVVVTEQKANKATHAAGQLNKATGKPSQMHLPGTHGGKGGHAGSGSKAAHVKKGVQAHGKPPHKPVHSKPVHQSCPATAKPKGHNTNFDKAMKAARASKIAAERALKKRNQQLWNEAFQKGRVSRETFHAAVVEYHKQYASWVRAGGWKTGKAPPTVPAPPI